MLEEQQLKINTGHLVAMFYGPPGTGKTTAAAKLKRKKILFIDVDQKLASMENLTTEERARIHVWTPNETLSDSGTIPIIRTERTTGANKNKVAGTENYVPTNPQGYPKTVAFINSLLERSKEKTFDYDLVVLDSFTRLMEHLNRLVLSHHRTAIFSLPLWGVYKSNAEEFVSGFLSLPCDRILIAHSKTVQDSITEEVLIRPMAEGQIADKLPKEFNEVYYFLGKDRQTKKYKLQTSASRKIVARTSKNLADEVDVDDVIGKL